MSNYIKFWLAKAFVELLPLLIIVGGFVAFALFLVVKEEIRKFCHRRAKAKVQP